MSFSFIFLILLLSPVAIQNWIEWLVSYPFIRAPIYDSIGTKVQWANSDRSGVFYLTGAPYHNVTRTVYIESNRFHHVLCPVIDGIFTYQATGIFSFLGNPEQKLNERNARFHITQAIATLDGIPLHIYNLKSDVFKAHYGKSNPYNITEGDWNTMISGDFIYFPIRNGNHILHIKGADTDGYHTEVIYQLHVADRAEILKQGVVGFLDN